MFAVNFMACARAGEARSMVEMARPAISGEILKGFMSLPPVCLEAHRQDALTLPTEWQVNGSDQGRLPKRATKRGGCPPLAVFAALRATSPAATHDRSVPLRGSRQRVQTMMQKRFAVDIMVYLID
jgi:hypothetical protein